MQYVVAQKRITGKNYQQLFYIVIYTFVAFNGKDHNNENPGLVGRLFHEQDGFLWRLIRFWCFCLI